MCALAGRQGQLGPSPKLVTSIVSGQKELEILSCMRTDKAMTATTATLHKKVRDRCFFGTRFVGSPFFLLSWRHDSGCGSRSVSNWTQSSVCFRAFSPIGSGRERTFSAAACADHDLNLILIWFYGCKRRSTAAPLWIFFDHCVVAHDFAQKRKNCFPRMEKF